MTPLGPEDLDCAPVPGQRKPETHANVHGQDALEYAMLVAVLVLAATAGVGYLAMHVNATFCSIGAKVSTYATTPATPAGTSSGVADDHDHARPRTKRVMGKSGM